MLPAVSATWPAVPASISTSLAPVFTISAVNDIGNIPGGRNAAASAWFTSAPLALRTNLSSIGKYQMPSKSAVSW